jgi:hypothetical protein
MTGFDMDLAIDLRTALLVYVKGKGHASEVQ